MKITIARANSCILPFLSLKNPYPLKVLIGKLMLVNFIFLINCRENVL